MNARRAEQRAVQDIAAGCDSESPSGPPPGAPPPAHDAPQAEILTPAAGAIYVADNTVAFTGRGTAAADRHSARIARRLQ
jgi:hypothetical protein